MWHEINRIYTDNPYVDEMVYYTKLIAGDIVLKNQQRAENNETLESIQASDLYISCIEGTAILELFPSMSRSALAKAGLTQATIDAAMRTINAIPINKRDAVLQNMKEEYIANYEELNNYYRMLYGLPDIGAEFVYVTDWYPPDGLVIDLSKPIHEMNINEIGILDNYGVLQSLYEEDPTNREYIKHLGTNKIDPYTARRASRFSVLYIPTVDQDAIQKMFIDRLESNKYYVLHTIYSDAYKYDSDYYDNFICLFIVLITMIDIIARVGEFISRKEIFDIRSVQYLFQSYGVPFFEDIPLRYQINMVKNIHTLLKYKSTSRCMIDICSLFGYNNITIFKYYMLRDRTVDLTTGDYVYATDEEGNEDYEKEFELKFLKLPLEEDLDDYVRVGSNYIDYDVITTGDSSWDGGLDHEEIKKAIMKEEFNYTRTKYISIDSTYDIAKMSAQQSYFFNMLYDNAYLETDITVSIPYISTTETFNIAHIFILLTVLTYYYRDTKDLIMDTQSKVLFVNGFNFKADLAELAANMAKTGYTLHAKEQLDAFIIPEGSIPSFGEMMNIFINNMDIRDELIKGMNEADNLRVFMVYKKLYDALMTVQLTMDYFINPETGDYYRDGNGDATYSAFLMSQNLSLYNVVLEVMSFDDDASRNQFIANLIDSIVYVLEEFIDTEEFSALFSNLPVVSSEAVKQYIATVINFYKSYKVDFLGINTIYYMDDKLENYLRLIDDIRLERFFEKEDFLDLFDSIKTHVNMTKRDKLRIIDRIYLDIFTWVNKEFDDRLDVWDDLSKIIKLLVYSVFQVYDDIAGIHIDREFVDMYRLIDYKYSSKITMTPKDPITVADRIWITEAVLSMELNISGDYNPRIYYDCVSTMNDDNTASTIIIADTARNVRFIPDPSIIDLVDDITYSIGDTETIITITGEYPVYGIVIFDDNQVLYRNSAQEA